MKSKTYIFGITCILIIVLGAFFKVQHWPFGGILLTLGLSTFALIFMPIALIKSYRAETDKKLKKLYIMAYISVAIDCAGALFKIQDWPGAGLFLIVSIPLPFVLFLPAYLLQIRKNKQLNYNNLLLVLFFFGYFAAISALLSLNVSKDILNQYADSAASYEQQTKFANLQTRNIIDSPTVQNTKDSVNTVTMKKIMTASNSLYEQIKRIQIGIMEASGDNQNIIDKNGTINFKAIEGKDNRSIYSIELFKEKADELKKSLSDFRELLLDNTTDTDITNYINTQLSTRGNWFYEKFEDKLMIVIMDALCAIKNNVAQAELETVRAIGGTL